MTENDAFLRAIIENPEDDAPRLMYADWLEERGDPRAEFIRVQYALEQLSEDDERRPALKEREKELLTVHGRAWTGRLRMLATHWSFRRGFVEEISVSAGTFLSRGNELFWLAPIRKVDLHTAHGLTAELARCRYLEHVKALDLGSNGMDVLHAATLLESPYLSRLEELRISLAELSGPCVRHLTFLRLARFATVHLHLSVTGDLSAENLARLSIPQSLKFVRLEGSGIGDHGLQWLTQSPLASRLTALKLRTNDTGQGSLTALASSKELTSLAHLDLSDNNIGPAGAQIVAVASQLASLRELHLAGNSLGEDGVRELVLSPHAGKLTDLDLGRNLLGTAGAKILADSPNLSALRRLALASNGLQDTGAEALARSMYLTRLTALLLESNRIGPRGASALAAAQHLSGLTELGLGGNRLGDAGAEALLASPHLIRLQSLGTTSGLSRGVARRLKARFPEDRLARLEGRP